MSKAILVLEDMPGLCCDCRFTIFDEDDGRRLCCINRKCTNGEYKPNWCPWVLIPDSCIDKIINQKTEQSKETEQWKVNFIQRFERRT